MSVQDTLRASVSLDNQAYDLDTDKVARLGIKMDYGYPHIYALAPDTIPTSATGVDRITATGEDEKDAATYTLGGVRLDPKGKHPAGVYIRNGKKIVVKP